MFLPITWPTWSEKSVCLCVVFAQLFLGKWQNDVTAFVLDLLSASMFTSHLLSLPVFTGLCEGGWGSSPLPPLLLLHHWCVFLDDGVCVSGAFCSIFVLVHVRLLSSRTCGSMVLVKPAWNTWWFRIWLFKWFFLFFCFFPVAELLVLTWLRYVCVWNWMTRIQRCYCNRGGPDGGAVSLCINTFVKPLLKTDDCSRRAQWISIKSYSAQTDRVQLSWWKRN